MKNAAVIYTRVSTLEQAEEGVSIDAQRARAIAWAEANGYEVAGIHSDAGISGKKASNRPALQAALTEVCSKHGSALIVYSLSRLARSTKDAISIGERLEKAGCDLVSLSEKIDTTSASGKMVFRMLAVLAEFERDLVSERTRSAMAHKRSKGECIGQVPFGFRLAEDRVKLEWDQVEQDTLSDMHALRAEGWSWQRIAADLNARGITTKKGRVWTWFNARKVAA
ncbi:MAG: recombinase family protein [Thermoanaerobaculia bacterium]